MTLSSAELAYMRDTVEQLMPDTCHILSVTQTVDGQGGYTENWGTATASVKCRLDRGIGARNWFSEELRAESLQPFDYWVLTMPYDTTITTENRVQIGTDTFNVEGVDDEKSWNACLRIMMRKVV